MKRKMGAPKPAPVKVRAPRRATVTFEKHAALPKAVVDGRFLPKAGSRVYVWRVRTGERPSWHTCEVLRAKDDLVELWDDTLGQCFGFNPTESPLPDVRMEGAPPTAGKLETVETVATKVGGCEIA